MPVSENAQRVYDFAMSQTQHREVAEEIRNDDRVGQPDGEWEIFGAAANWATSAARYWRRAGADDLHITIQDLLDVVTLVMGDKLQ